MIFYSVESFEAYNDDSDKINPRKINVECPNCKRKFAALCSKNTKALAHQNIGCPDYDDYASVHLTKCGKCKHEFKFGVSE